jgi:hypothetical protein
MSSVRITDLPDEINLKQLTGEIETALGRIPKFGMTDAGTIERTVVRRVQVEVGRDDNDDPIYKTESRREVVKEDAERAIEFLDLGVGEEDKVRTAISSHTAVQEIPETYEQHIFGRLRDMIVQLVRDEIQRAR